MLATTPSCSHAAARDLANAKAYKEKIGSLIGKDMSQRDDLDSIL